MPNCEICEKNETRLKRLVMKDEQYKLCPRCYSVIIKNLNIGKNTKMNELERYNTSEETTVKQEHSKNKKSNRSKTTQNK